MAKCRILIKSKPVGDAAHGIPFTPTRPAERESEGGLPYFFIAGADIGRP